MLFSVPLIFQLKMPALGLAYDRAQQPDSKSAFEDKVLRTSQREYKILIFFFTLGKSLKVTSLLKFQVAFGFTKSTLSGSFQSH